MFFLDQINLLFLCKQYGYWFVFIGALLEGDMITVSAGYNSYYGQFNIVNLMLFVLTVTVCADQMVFFYGKKYKQKVLGMMNDSSYDNNFFIKKIRTGYNYFYKYGDFIGIIFRFLVSVRLITPFILGTTEMKQSRFLLLNLISGIIWVVLMCGGGYILAYYYTYEQIGKVFSWLPLFGIAFMSFITIRSFLK
jgi:membrane protein DedA with SNARE-associated domain